MKDIPLVSILMPAYNAEKFITEAIESVINQDYDNWELIVADDCSTDNTVSIVEGFHDSRIRIVHTDINSGVAYVPRLLATDAATGDFILYLDSDDYLDCGYINMLVDRIIKTDADICLSKMVYIEQENGKATGETVPDRDFDYSKLITGKLAFQWTLPFYKIGLNGMVCKINVWKRSLLHYEKLKKEKHGIHDDEVAARLTLLEANKVAFSENNYYYRTNLESVTHKFNIKIFDYRESISDEMKLFSEILEADPEIMGDVKIQDYYAFKMALCAFCENVIDMPFGQANIYIGEFKRWYNRIDKAFVQEKCDEIRVKFFGNFKLFFLLCCLKRKFFFKSFKIMRLFLHNAIIGNKYYLWHNLRKQREKQILQKLHLFYGKTDSDEIFLDNCVVAMYDGKIQAGGLADRLKGIISVYSICKENGLRFKIYFTDPFPLEEYLMPNKVDWRIDAGSITYSDKAVRHVVLDSTQDSRYQFKKQYFYLKKHLHSEEGIQTHVHTNAGFAYGRNYQELFHELFRLSDRLQLSVDRQINILGKDYISISCRFMDLLDDFNETHGYRFNLSQTEKDALVDKVIGQMSVLHEANPDKKILVNSDSITFLDRAKQLAYAYVIAGNVTHIDGENTEYSYEKYEKTFLDFFMIANASQIYLLKTDLMYKSGYPYAASKVYNHRFELIEF